MTALAMGILDSVRFEPVRLTADDVSPPLYSAGSEKSLPIELVFNSNFYGQLTLKGQLIGDARCNYFAGGSASDTDWTMSFSRNDAVAFVQAFNPNFSTSDERKVIKVIGQLTNKILNTEILIGEKGQRFSPYPRVVIDSDL